MALRDSDVAAPVPVLAVEVGAVANLIRLVAVAGMGARRARSVPMKLPTNAVPLPHVHNVAVSSQ